MNYVAANPEVTSTILRDVICSELIATNERRSLLSNKRVSVLKIPPRSLDRYVKRVRVGMFNYR